ncbi:signal recognition particle subunit SRP19 [Trypanosoma rangeli]|uniref:Signal recognition particle subunit SRP19 n=1 Tax=Trypanosoma rangeli TaxID=5698 RepID=A0A3R7MSQ5_TRYRA|nr:signal recognition particle subunit SRP19 [Trypanosoma rangeli]RNF07499.1 signal recognition particle subunit SRP19 [Trypanosoma rangeli]|eukprot:RNF07499.1 signal recognition particle subunit SRP19 [Trypanosoma rangeli]
MQPPSASHKKLAYQTIFPQYLDANLTPSEGRRLTRTQSVENPQLEEIVVVLRELGYQDFFIERNLSLPRSQACNKYAIVPKGCVRVAIKRPQSEHYIRMSDFDTQTRGVTVQGIGSKQELLRRVAAAIKASCAARPQPVSFADVTGASVKKKSACS